MKHIPLLFAALLCLTACTPASPHTPPTVPNETQAETADLAAAIAAYQARIDDLEAALLSLKEESYIARAEYERRIHSLTAEILALRAQLAMTESPSPTPDLPVSGTPQKPPETVPDTDRPPAMAFHYEIREGHAVILAYLGDETEVTIPAVIEGYPVTVIEENAFRGTSVVTVTVPYSVSEISWFAFADCQSLATVTVSPSVESIGYGAFDGCPHLTIICPADSYSANYAESFGIPHKEK
jgi:hypothetical protein